MEAQATGLRSELLSLQAEISLLRNERGVARLLNEYIDVHDRAFSPSALEDERLDQEFEGFFTEGGVIDAFGVQTNQPGKADWVRTALNDQENIVGMQMMTSHTLMEISDDGQTATARTGAMTAVVSGEPEAPRCNRTAGWYTYKLRKENGEWRISHLKWSLEISSQPPPAVYIHSDIFSLIHTLGMVYLSPRFRGLVATVALALVVDALPHNERMPLDEKSIEITGDHTDIINLRRDTKVGPTGGGETRITRQREPDEPLQLSRMSRIRAREESLPIGPFDSGASPVDVREHSATTKRHHHHSHHHHYHHDHHEGHWHVEGVSPSIIDGPSIAADDPVIISGNDNHVHVHSHARRDDQAEVEAAIQEAVGSIPSHESQIDKRHHVAMTDDGDIHVHEPSFKRHHHHHHHARPDDTSKGGHSGHWYEHHHLDPSRLHHHHHDRMYDLDPRRIRDDDYEEEEEDDDKGENTFIAPASVRVKPGNRVKLGSSTVKNNSTTVAASTATKKLKPVGPTGLYRAVQPAGGNESPVADSESKVDRQVDGGTRLTQRDAEMDEIYPILATTPPKTTIPIPDGISGTIELLSNGNSTKLGTLSVSPTPVHTTLESYFHNATALAYLIDATTKPAEYTTFYMRKYDDQSLLPKSTDVLVSLQARFDFAGFAPLCATFNPNAKDVQTFGLAVCTHSPVGGTGSQGWRYEPGTGAVKPFYGADGNKPVKASEVDDSDEVDYLDDLDYGYSTFTNDSNTTTVNGPGTSPVFFSPPDPLLRPVSLFNATLNSTSTNSTSSSGSPKLAVQSSSDPTHAFVVGDMEYATTESKPGEGVLMVFRRMYAVPKDVKIKAQAEPPRMDLDDTSSEFVETVEQDKTLEARVVPPPLGYTGFEPGQPGDEMDYNPMTGSEEEPIIDNLDDYNAEHDDEFQSNPVPKPVINVAYFGDSGRSPPVPPEAQAAGAKAILMAVASKGKSPMTSAASDGEGDDTVAVYLVRPRVLAKAEEQMVSVAQVNEEKLPLDASD